ncbi:DUF4012 domain-containing protein [candidate division WWE3 bacterium]|nr:DUF4012 domain-containing protein [candidate division WWE3 bacterium]
MFRIYAENKWRIVLVLGVIITMQLCLYVLFIKPIRDIAYTAGELYGEVLAFRSTISSNDLSSAETHMSSIKLRLEDLRVRLNKIRYVRHFPYLSGYYEDSQNLIQAGIIFSNSAEDFLVDFLPFAPVVGIGSGSETGTSDQKLQQLVTLAPQLLPTIDRSIDDLEKALPYLLNLHWELYPNTSEYPIRDTLHKVVDVSTVAQSYLSEARTFLKVFPSMFGEPSTKKYLVLFQNDKEIRPTGGFITSYTTLTIDSGKITIEDAKNIYEVSKSEGFLPAPDPIKQYLKVTAWHMRDTNFSPDFKTSMDTFDSYWRQLGLTKIDGIITLDTQFVAGLLKQLGPIEIADYDNDFSAYPNVPAECKQGGSTFTSDNVVCRLEYYAQRLTNEQTTRKAVIGDLMEKMFDQLMTAPSNKWYPLISEVLTELSQKHMLTYFKDQDVQDLGERLNWTGRIQDTSGDYLHINDANLAGLKSDMYLKRSVDQRLDIAADGSITKTVALTYENTGAFDGWLNATARNYVRVYVPKGSKLIDVSGGEAKTTTHDDLGKTVFDNFITVKPKSSTTITFTYQIPMKYSDDMDILIQKQPGIDRAYHSLDVNGQKQQFELLTDLRLNIKK